MNQTQRTKKDLCSKHALGEFYPSGRRRGELKKITFVKWHRRIYGRFPCNMHKTETYPDKFKVKLEKRDSDELGKLYDFLFDELHCRWAGRTGHYCYVDDGEEHQLAPVQDGYLYVFKHDNRRVMTADSTYGNDSFVEILRPAPANCPKCKGSKFTSKQYLWRKAIKRRRPKRISWPCSHCSGKRWIVSELGYRHHCRHCGDGRVYY